MTFDEISNFLDKMKTLEARDTVVEEAAPEPYTHPLVLAMRELQAEGIVETASTGQGGGSAGNGGGQMVGGPTTYEQEYDMFKRKGPRRITAMTNEALDSSYAYKVGPDNRFYFTTDLNIEYRVTIIPSLENSVEILFSSKDAKGSYDIKMTGTGDQYKVMGTIVKIIKEYVDNKKPSKISFSALKSEPSKIKLYSRMANMVDSATSDYVNEKPHSVVDEITFILRRKENISEALDSSYPYDFRNNAYYFTTDKGNEYKVEFDGTKKVEVSFSIRDKTGQVKTTITGTGDSRKVFGTVIEIVKEYVSHHNPEIIVFAADSNAPSRIKLYKSLAAQADKALPGYAFVKTLKNAWFTVFYLTRDNIKVPKLDTVKNITQNVLDKVFEETTTLTQLYKDGKPDRDETIWDYGTMIWDDPYEIEIISPRTLDIYLCDQYNVEFLADLFEKMKPEQHEIVDHYMNDPDLSNKIIVLDNGYIVDGNHRAIAAALTKRPIKYIDIGEEDSDI
jgi:hypothetical protein